ncbi:MAG: MIP family channel protein [Eubacteriaceae bacterium]|nr:MIP family channel protein [Eubacteriaceae bacterium]
MKKYIAEFIGTLVLVTFGCGAAVAANTLVGSMGLTVPLGFTTLLIAFAFGLSIVAMAYSIGNVSGCHVNPAVSLGMLVAGRMTVKDFVGYIVAQFAGGAAGAAILWGIFASRESLGQNGYGSNSALGIDMMTALVVEVILTFVFVLAVLGVTSKVENAGVAGIVIGLSLTLVHILGIPFTGTSVNPARSFGPAIFAQGDALSQLPVFIIAPFVGGAIAALVYRFVIADKTEKA